MIKNKKDVKRLEAELQSLLHHLHQFTEENFNQKIKDVWKKLQLHIGNENLKKLPVDTISTLEKGMPINVLLNNGFRTIYDLKNHAPEDLMRINGIGEKSAYPIYEAVAKIKESVYEQANPRVNPDQLSPEAVELLETIYKKWELSELAASLKTNVETLNDTIHPVIETAKKRRNFISSLFQSRETKAEIKEAFEQLNEVEFRKNLADLKKRQRYILTFSVNREELINHFVAENASYYTEIETITGFVLGEGEESLPAEIVEAVKNSPLDTTGLDVSLRKYQTFGAKYALYYRRTLLGDEMGLGKTIQALAMINHLAQNDQKYAMVVCPLSVLANWKREIKELSKLHTFIFHGSNRDEAFAKWQAQTGVLLTTYGHTSRMNVDEAFHLDVFIVDEAHYVKNPDAKRSQSVYKLADSAEYVLFMSGTPLENRLEEMKQLISVLQPEISNQLSQELHLLQPEEFKQLVAPVYLRRNRKEVLAELPELEIIPQWVNFGEEEKKLYDQAVMAGHVMAMRRAAWLGGSPEKSPKLERLLEICMDAAENGQKVLVFSFFRDVITTIQNHLQGKTFEPITGDVPNARRQEIIDDFTNAGAGSVLISQITAGGVGLNIQAANIVILCEPQWKPSTEEQAISRAYRMGQSRDVVVYRLLTEESIDETMLEILGEKANLFDLYARESDVASLALHEREEAEEEESLEQQVLRIEKERVEQKDVGKVSKKEMDSIEKECVEQKEYTSHGRSNNLSEIEKDLEDQKESLLK